MAEICNISLCLLNERVERRNWRCRWTRHFVSEETCCEANLLAGLEFEDVVVVGHCVSDTNFEMLLQMIVPLFTSEGIWKCQGSQLRTYKC